MVSYLYAYMNKSMQGTHMVDWSIWRYAPHNRMFNKETIIFVLHMCIVLSKVKVDTTGMDQRPNRISDLN